MAKNIVGVFCVNGQWHRILLNMHRLASENLSKNLITNYIMYFFHQCLAYMGHVWTKREPTSAHAPRTLLVKTVIFELTHAQTAHVTKVMCVFCLSWTTVVTSASRPVNRWKCFIKPTLMKVRGLILRKKLKVYWSLHRRKTPTSSQ